ncbi:MAG: nucleotidyltransferase domain-containing protein [Bacteroidota bacterium]
MKTKIRPHHQQGIDNLVAEYKNDPRFIALIIGGSVAKGCARADSDIDFMIVATDKVFDERKAKSNLFINRTNLTDYAGGFVDGKIIDMAYLEMVDKKGNEPTRAAFDGAFVAFSKMEGLDRLIERIGQYPEELRCDKLKSFYAMSFIQNWLMNEAERHNNRYTKSRAASQLVLFAGRLILAHNRIFFPYHKWFYEYLGRCREKPEGLMHLMDTLLREPNAKHSATLFQAIKGFQDWGVSDIEAFSWFMEEVEWGWVKNKASLEDW